VLDDSDLKDRFPDQNKTWNQEYPTDRLQYEGSKTAQGFVVDGHNRLVS
jgi:hypothetical protein